MSNIEEAVRRLEQLRKSGIEAAGAGGERKASAPQGDSLPPPTPERLAEILPSRSASPGDPGAPAGAPPALAAEGGAAGSGAGIGMPGVPPVDIDLEAMARAGYITPGGPRHQLAQEFRVIKRPIIGNAHSQSATRIERSNCVMVTSALPGEGKTFFAINLAMSIAKEVDSSVLLVDADVAKPSFAKVLNIRPEKGLMDVLASEHIDVGDLILRTNVDKLALLLSGTPHPRATELLASQAMANLVNEIATRYRDRIVIFDSPPLLVTTEARVLAAHMGQIVMVVESSRTTRLSVTRALETIEGSPTVLMVLNKAPHSEVSGYYDYSKYPVAP